MRNHWIKWLLLPALPLVLLLVIAKQNSWRPRTLRVGASNIQLHFSPNGETLIVERDADLGSPPWRDFQLWNVSRGQLQRTLPTAKSHSYPLALSPDTTMIAGGVTDTDIIKVWDVSTGQLKHTFTHHLPFGLVASNIAFSPDSQFLAQGCWDQQLYTPPIAGKILLWDLQTGELRHSFKSDGFLFRFSPDGRTLAASNGRTVQIWNVSTGALLHILNSGNSRLDSFFFSPNGQKLIGDGAYATLVWDTRSGALLCKLKPQFLSQSSPMFLPAFSRDGNMLANVTKDNTIELLNLNTGKLTRRFSAQKGTVSRPRFTPDGRILASVSNQTDIPFNVNFYSGPGVPVNGQVNLWNTRTGQLLGVLKNNLKPLGPTAFSPDGQMLAVASEGEVLLCQSKTGHVLRRLTSSNDAITSLSFSPDGCTLATSDKGQKVTLWRIQ